MSARPTLAVAGRIRDRFHRFGLTARGLRADVRHLQAFVLFVGNPRSGTTLVRSILDAHPEVALGQEADVLGHLGQGEGWTTLVGRILRSRERFAANPTWNGHAYRLEAQGRAVLRVLGDKKAARSATVLMDDPHRLDRLARLVPAPLRLLHCVRHPLDAIASRQRGNGRSPAWNLERYFDLEEAALSCCERIGPGGWHRVHLEALVAAPAARIRDLAHFIGVQPGEEYVRTAARLVFPHPHLTRGQVPWTSDLLARARERAARLPHLAAYELEP